MQQINQEQHRFCVKKKKKKGCFKNRSVIPDGGTDVSCLSKEWLFLCETAIELTPLLNLKNLLFTQMF